MPDAAPPSLPKLIVYVMLPPVRTVDVADFVSVIFELDGVGDVEASDDEMAVVPFCEIIAASAPLMK